MVVLMAGGEYLSFRASIGHPDHLKTIASAIDPTAEYQLVTAMVFRRAATTTAKAFDESEAILGQRIGSENFNLLACRTP